MLNEKLSELYSQNHADGQVIPGGVMNEEDYLSSNIKMMMLMKEVNDSEQKYNWTLPELLTRIYNRNNDKAPFYRTWKNVSRWAICAQTPQISFEEISEANLYEGLKLFATTNLKKSCGTGQSDYNDIFEHARMNRVEWTSEIEILDPELIVCAGTFDIVKEIMGMQDQSRVCKSGAHYFVNCGRIYLDFVHPAYQVSDKLMFAYFKETFRSLLEEIKLL